MAGLDAPLDEVGLLGPGEGTTALPVSTVACGRCGRGSGNTRRPAIPGLAESVGARIALGLAQEVAAEDVEGLFLVGAEAEAMKRTREVA